MGTSSWVKHRFFDRRYGYYAARFGGTAKVLQKLLRGSFYCNLAVYIFILVAMSSSTSKVRILQATVTWMFYWHNFVIADNPNISCVTDEASFVCQKEKKHLTDMDGRIHTHSKSRTFHLISLLNLSWILETIRGGTMSTMSVGLTLSNVCLPYFSWYDTFPLRSFLEYGAKRSESYN